MKDVLLLQSRVDRLEQALTGQTADLKELAQNVIDVDRRVSQIEGYLRGRAEGGRWRATPRVEG